MKSKNTSRRKSDRIYSGFLQWREDLINLDMSIIVVEGKRDVEVLHSLGLNESSNVKIIKYSQIPLATFEDEINKTNRNTKIIPLVDFDAKGEEYLQEIKQFKHCDLELRNNLYSLTNGRLQQFEHLLIYLKKQLHHSYWINLEDILF